MRIRTVRHIVKEGALNAYKNKLMSLASVSIVTASLIIFGIFLLIALNLEFNINTLKDQPQMEVFCYPILDDTQVKQVEDTIRNNDKIAEYQVVTKLQAFEKVKGLLGEDAKVLEGYNESFLPVSFIVKVKDPTQSAEVVAELKDVSGVEKVQFSQSTIEMISKITYWIKLISGIMIVILLVVSVFIIANTIKLTVFARRREISIMKFIGATDWFIRWPFVVEGVIIGIAGAAIAFTISSLSYNAIEGRVNGDILAVSRDFLKLLKIKDIWFQMVAFFSMIGIVVGALGSFLSIRRYLRV